MNKFSEMSQFEINKLTYDEFMSISPFEKKSCYDCIYLQGYYNLWCTSVEARKARGTTIPGIIKCPYWSPNYDFIDVIYKSK